MTARAGKSAAERVAVPDVDVEGQLLGLGVGARRVGGGDQLQGEKRRARPGRARRRRCAAHQRRELRVGAERRDDGAQDRLLPVERGHGSVQRVGDGLAASRWQVARGSRRAACSDRRTEEWSGRFARSAEFDVARRRALRP